MYKRLRAPLTVQIEVTTHCDNACVHCYNHWRHDRPAPPRHLTPAEAERIVDRVAAAGVFDIVITGGEPLLARDTVRALLDRARVHGLGVSLNSNLTQLTPKDITWLAGTITSILTSVHGPREIHDRITHRPGAFEATARGIGLARAAGIPVHANMVICQMNKHHVLETARLCERLGVNAFLASKAAQPEHCDGFAPLRLTPLDVAAYVRDLRTANLGMPVEVLSTYPLCGIADNADLAVHGRRCLAGVAMLTIAADGAARPCNHSDQTYGSIWDSSLEAIWARMDEWREGRFMPEVCRVCPALMLCGGGCRMEAKTWTGDMAGLDPYARPENLPRTIPFLREREQAPANPPRAFSLNPHRSREESFGLVLCAPAGAPLMLSPEGARVWKQFSPGLIYFSDDPAIRWGNVERGPFLAALERKKLITAR